MAMPAVLPVRSFWTVDDVDALPEDGRRYELLHGELLVNPPPEIDHERVVLTLFRALAEWCDAHTGWAVHLRGTVQVGVTTRLEPDITVYPAPDRGVRHWRELPVPVLVVEVASPSSVRRDRFAKRAAYLAAGVAEVWTMHPVHRRLERWTAASEFPTVIDTALHWAPASHSPPFELPLTALFPE
ncbi:MAG: Uma2 family endonuclease [Gemmatimonadaceae bacterium]|jgi:Uma2 family endonuclease|nr:Uma2 family endonuclease [Gemmatimonadaceae bacterium]